MKFLFTMLFDQLFGRESFQLVHSRVATATPETDLFAGRP